MMKYAFVRPEIAPVDEWNAILDASYAASHFTNFGIVETKLSQALAERFAATSVSVTLASNATNGLTAALLAHGVQGNVVIPNFTFPATLDAVLAARCRPILCDVDATTGEIDLAELKAAIARFSVAAVMPVRPYGFVRNIRGIVDLARASGIPVIVDAAAALGGGGVEAAPDLTEVFSLHATKSIGIGEGAAIFAHESMRPKLVKALNFGLNADRTFEYGINGKMSEFQAAVGLAQMAHIDRLISGRQAMANWYFDLLHPFFKLSFLDPPDVTPWSNFPIFLPRKLDTAAFEKFCHARSYQVRRYYWPTISEGFCEAIPAVSLLPISLDLGSRAVCLPLYASVAQHELAEIRLILLEAFAAFGVGDDECASF